MQFNTFANLCIDRCIITAVRKSLRKKQIPSDMLVPLDDVDVIDNDDPERMIIEKESYDRLMASVEKKLTLFEFSVLTRYLSGDSYRHIAESLQCDIKAVDNAMVRIRRKLKRGRMS